MSTVNLLLIITAVLAAGILVYYQYFRKQKINRDTLWLSLLRFLSWFGILLLLLNPTLQKKETEIERPALILALDNSFSMEHLGVGRQVLDLKNSFLRDEELNARFDLNAFSFGSGLSTDTVLSFDKNSTNIFKTIKDADAIGRGQISPIILVSDGNQTYGNNYAYMKSANPIFPVVVGDTVVHQDIGIERINVNDYATLHNNFPVEIFLSSTVAETLNTTMSVERKGIQIYRAPVTFSPERKLTKISLMLPADSSGIQLYKVKMGTFTGELNTRNNNKNFGVEILDEQAEIEVVYGVLHPDLGMIKRSVETNKQRKVLLTPVEKFQKDRKGISVFVLYQPDRRFEPVIRALKEQRHNFFIMTGSHTDWSYLNDADLGFKKTVTGIEEKVYPSFHHSFASFYVEDIGFDEFPPLRASLGGVSFQGTNDLMLTHEINGIDTETPLLAIYSRNDSKGVLWSGEDVWKWRAASFEQDGSFERFDLFFNSLIQYMQLSDRESDLELVYQPVFHADEPVVIRAKIYDSNLQVSFNSKLALRLKDSKTEAPFYVNEGYYEIRLDNLKEGTYDFEVQDLDSDQKKSGSFLVVPFSIEQESSRPNTEDLQLLATNSGGTLYFQDQFGALKDQLLDNEQFRSIETERTKLISLIDWKWLLGLIVLSLSLEWLLRKYRGLI